jgi:hypothetical protein
MKIALASLFVLTLATACSDGAAPPADQGTATSFPANAYTTVASDTGRARVEVRTSPTQPPVRGVDTLELRVIDAAGNAIDGVTLDVVLWMPAMGHGASVVPTVTPMGNGRYVLTNVDLFMPGTWELRTTLSGSVSDHAAPSLDIP